jgi:hypothetical protein
MADGDWSDYVAGAGSDPEALSGAADAMGGAIEDASPAGASPAGASPAGASPSGASPAGTSPHQPSGGWGAAGPASGCVRACRPWR